MCNISPQGVKHLLLVLLLHECIKNKNYLFMINLSLPPIFFNQVFHNHICQRYNHIIRVPSFPSKFITCET
ncbi:hypothetical protein HanXRQr2_Chr01g0020681 [Helianthus annuus]|uniref:Uncharacterized protein n=1 Tax=Helianthus annuus TaxID=4232 RepID=A0A9K3JUY1_HELAN|nr:hypothetical protein HanXRQr2_Chr01g0020681 [Helianthus annuus]